MEMPLLAFISVTPTDPGAPDDVPDRLRDIDDLEACHSVAGEESYILKARVATPGDLEDLLALIRSSASVSTRTTVVLSTPWEERPRPVE
jgi:Lrp/AsnC family leucine-responsive transcriptional regulator